MLSLDLKTLLQGFSNLKQGTQLEKKLINIKFPLDEYLNDEEAIQCYKDMKDNAKKFFDKQKIQLLIKYITEEPKKENYLQGHKCPYVAYEMLRSECDYIQDLFVLSQKEYNEKYKEVKKEVNPIDNNGKYLNLVPRSIENYNYPVKKDNNNQNIDNNDKNIDKEDKINEEKKEEKSISRQKDNNNNIENKNDINNNDKDNNHNNQEGNNSNVKVNQITEENKIEKDSDKINEPNNNNTQDEENIPKDNIKKDKKEEEKKEKEEDIKEKEEGKKIEEKSETKNGKEEEVKKEEEKNDKKNEKEEERKKKEEICDIKNEKEEKGKKEKENKEIEEKNDIKNEKVEDNKIEDKKDKKKEEIKNDKPEEKEEKEKKEEREKKEEEEKEKEENNNKEKDTKKEEIKKDKEKPLINNEKKKEEEEINIIKEKKEDNENKTKNIIIEEKKENNINNTIKTEEKPNELNDIYNLLMTRNEFLDLLLNFVMDDNPILNDVLSGYFANVLLSLLDKYTYKILIYLYTLRKDALIKILFHSYQKSLSMVSLKLLKLQNIYSLVVTAKKFDESNVNPYYKIIDNCTLIRNELIGKIILSLSLDGFKDEKGNIIKDINVEPIFLILYDLIGETEILKYIVNSRQIYYHILDILETKVYNKNNNDEKKKFIYYLYIILLTRMFFNMNKNREVFDLIKDLDFNFIENKDLQQLKFIEKTIISIISLLMFNFIDNSTINNANKPNDFGWGLGLHNIYIMNLMYEISIYMRQIQMVVDRINIETKFIDKSIDYFFKYQLNNIYHLKFLQLFKLYLDDESAHTAIREHLFTKYKFHEMLSDYINQKKISQIIENKPTPNEPNKKKEEIIDNKNTINNNENKEKKQEINNNKNIINEREKSYYINEYKYRCGNKTLSCSYGFMVYLMYKIQAVRGLIIFDEKEKKDLNIKNVGEFEFIKDENSPKDIKLINISVKLNEILKLSSKWNNTFDNKVLPLIKKYEGNLCPKEGITTSTSAKNAINTSAKNIINNNLMKSLMNIIAKKAKIVININENEYNDVNFWGTKPSISLELKNKINEENNNNNKDNKNISNNTENKNNDEIKEDNKDSNKKREEVDEEDELLGLAMKLEQKEKSESYKSFLKGTSSNTNASPSSNAPKATTNNKSNIINSNNSKNSAPSPTLSSSNKISNLNVKVKDKEDKNSKYNDTNFWSVKPESILKEDEIKTLLEDL